MSEPMKIRAQVRGDFTEIRVLMPHPMETGLRRENDKPVPAHFIQHLTVELAGRRVVEAQIGPAVARNPVFAFRVSGAKPGDKVVVSWRDSAGEQRSDSAIVGS